MIIFAFSIILITALLALSFIDVKYFRLPDSLTFPLIGLGIAYSWIVLGEPLNAVMGAGLGYFAFVGLAYLFKIFRGVDGLGRGDAKLFAVGGAWCGWVSLPTIALIASLIGIVFAFLPLIRKRNEKGWIPFGPFLAVGIIICHIISIYR